MSVTLTLTASAPQNEEGTTGTMVVSIVTGPTLFAALAIFHQQLVALGSTSKPAALSLQDQQQATLQSLSRPFGLGGLGGVGQP